LIRPSTPITNQGEVNPFWRQRAIVDFPEEDPPFRTMTWVPTFARYHCHLSAKPPVPVERRKRWLTRTAAGRLVPPR
jgi:hypothetical protein